MGGTRFNGLFVTLELYSQGHDVTIFNRGRTEAEIPPEVHRLYGDRKDHDRLWEAVSGKEFDCVIDVNAYTVDDVSSMVEMLDGRTGHYIFVSTANVYAPSEVYPITEDFPLDEAGAGGDYPAGKVACETYLRRAHRQRGFPYTIARLSLVYGPRNFSPYREQMMFMRLLKGRRILLPGPGDTLTQPGYVEDGVQALVRMMGNKKIFGEAYNVAGPQAVTDSGYVGTLAAITGVEPEVVHIPADDMDAVAAVMPYPLTLRISRTNLRWSENVVCSVEKLKDHVGYWPGHTLEQGMRRTFEWFQREKLSEKLVFDFSVEDELIERYRTA